MRLQKQIATSRNNGGKCQGTPTVAVQGAFKPQPRADSCGRRQPLQSCFCAAYRGPIFYAQQLRKDESAIIFRILAERTQFLRNRHLLCVRGRKPKETGFPVNLRRLDCRDFMPAKAFAHNVQPARQRGIAEAAIRLTREGRPDLSHERFLWIDQLHLRFGQRSRYGRDRVTGAVHE
jgi:hypothetical protein